MPLERFLQRQSRRADHPDVTNEDPEALRALIDHAFAIGALLFISLNFLGNSLSLLSRSLTRLCTRKKRGTVQHLARLIDQGPQVGGLTPGEAAAIHVIRVDEHSRAKSGADDAVNIWDANWNRAGLWFRWLGALGGLLFGILAVLT
jgi:hypothetical protein